MTSPSLVGVAPNRRRTPEPASEALVPPRPVQALLEIGVTRVLDPHPGLVPIKPMLPKDPAKLTLVDAPREVRRESAAVPMVAVHVEAFVDRLELCALLRHGPRKVEVVRADGRGALVETSHGE